MQERVGGWVSDAVGTAGCRAVDGGGGGGAGEV